MSGEDMIAVTVDSNINQLLQNPTPEECFLKIGRVTGPQGMPEVTIIGPTESVKQYLTDTWGEDHATRQLDQAQSYSFPSSLLSRAEAH